MNKIIQIILFFFGFYLIVGIFAFPVVGPISFKWPTLFFSDYSVDVSMGFLYLITFLVPAILVKKLGWAKGLLLGGLTAGIYNFAIDGLILKRLHLVSPCSDLCGIENIFIGILQLVMLVLGLILLSIKKLKSTR